MLFQYGTVDSEWLILQKYLAKSFGVHFSNPKDFRFPPKLVLAFVSKFLLYIPQCSSCSSQSWLTIRILIKLKKQTAWLVFLYGALVSLEKFRIFWEFDWRLSHSLWRKFLYYYWWGLIANAVAPSWDILHWSEFVFIQHLCFRLKNFSFFPRWPKSICCRCFAFSASEFSFRQNL